MRAFMTTSAGFTATFFLSALGFATRKTWRAVPSFVQLLGSPRHHTHECGDMAFFRVHIPPTIEYTYMQVRCICLSCIVSPRIVIRL